MKNLRQIKDLINNMSRDKNINAQILLRNYMLERLLERISLSEFKEKFILKGITSFIWREEVKIYSQPQKEYS